MADQDRPNQNANKTKAEGERWSAEQYSVKNADRDEHPEQQYDAGDRDDAGGITNRPLSEEVGSQESLPERGTTREQTDDAGSRRREGDYQGE
ncbi:MAG TPA: hypothetical protein VM364_10945 [Vicinamibacterales bacterium]|nr:hypothetical protein [Vicinamibacterales bacterium]